MAQPIGQLLGPNVAPQVNLHRFQQAVAEFAFRAFVDLRVLHLAGQEDGVFFGDGVAVKDEVFRHAQDAHVTDAQLLGFSPNPVGPLLRRAGHRFSGNGGRCAPIEDIAFDEAHKGAHLQGDTGVKSFLHPAPGVPPILPVIDWGGPSLFRLAQPVNLVTGNGRLHPPVPPGWNVAPRRFLTPYDSHDFYPSTGQDWADFLWQRFQPKKIGPISFARRTQNTPIFLSSPGGLIANLL
ncbi:MAG: hypothetical protein CL608_29345 [Anaerolineaceae bacterium]|nr:hypothetical protein [Anaerolineaceae bacterium]